MSETLKLKALLSASPKDVYDAWIDGKKHTAMTGNQPATSEKKVGGAYTAWDGYIFGKHLVLEAGARIVQTWRATDFPKDAPDSLLEIELEGTDDETHLTLIHSELPNGSRSTYSDGWHEFYFDPMRGYFEALHAAAAAKKPSKKAAAKKPAAKKAPAAKKPAAKKPAAKKAPAAKKPAAKKAAKR